MPKGKVKRWVPKGKKTKGFRKTGRVRKVKKEKGTYSIVRHKEWVAHMMPPKGFKQYLPDKLYTSTQVEANYSVAAGAWTVGHEKYCCIPVNNCFAPFDTAPNCTNTQLITVVESGANTTPSYYAMSAVRNIHDYKTVDESAPFMQTLDQVYTKKTCYKHELVIDIMTYDLKDNYDVAIQPITGDSVLGLGALNYTYTNCAQGRHSKVYQVDDWAGSLPHHKIKLKNKTDLFYGEKLTPEQMLISGGTLSLSKYSQIANVAIAAPVGYQLCMRNRISDGAGGSASNVTQINFKFTLKQYIIFNEARMFNTQ